MFIGHFAVALACKKPAPQTSLGTFFMAAQLPDLLWPIFLILGVERVQIAPGNTAVTPLAFVYYPYSHSLLGVVLWATLFSSAYKLIRKNSVGALWIWLAVFSHWILDYITHRPDLALYPGSSIFMGLGLWNSRLGTFIVEGGMFVIALFIYLQATRARDKTGIYSFWAFVVFLVSIYLANLFGPPPPSVGVLEVSTMGIWLLVAWGFWIDRHHEARL
jgi:membrane-bound metal-dependent hydrolase YbcI (DUF457 family)